MQTFSFIPSCVASGAYIKLFVDTIKKDYRRGRGSHKTSYLLFYELNLERGGGLSCPQYLMLVNN